MCFVSITAKAKAAFAVEEVWRFGINHGWRIAFRTM
jgi:hypothetical protein